MKVLKILGKNRIDFFDEEIPEVGPRDVLTRVRYCGVCGTDVSIYSGETSLVRDGLIKYPVIPGHEWSGIVEAVGSEVEDVKAGDRVVGDTVVSCGFCKSCLSGNYMKCDKLRCVGTVNAWDGAFAEYTLFPARHIYKIPDSIPLDEAATIEPAALAMNAIYKSNFKAGQTVLVIGTGAIGLVSVRLTSASGASKVILSGRKDVKLETGRIMGADIAVNINKENLKETVMRETGGEGVDLVIEASGAVSALREALDMVKIDGTIALLGFYEEKVNELNVDKAVFNCIKVIGIAGSPSMYTPVIDLMASGKVSFKHIITHRYAFKDAVEAFKDMKGKNDTRIKILVEF